MKMSVKRGYLLELRKVLMNADIVFDGPISCKVRYAFSVNLKRCYEEWKEIGEGFPDDPKFLEYEAGRRKIRFDAGIRSAADEAKLTPEQRADLDKQIEKFAEPYADAIKAQNEIVKARVETLNESVEVDLRTITPVELPDIVIKDDANHIWEKLFFNKDWYVWNILFNDGAGIVRD